jgi:hypothetical protein
VEVKGALQGIDDSVNYLQRKKRKETKVEENTVGGGGTNYR